MMKSTLSLLLRNQNRISNSVKNVYSVSNVSTSTTSSYLRSFSTAQSAATAEVKVPTTLIQELRKKTSAPITDCKKALQASENDMDKAIAWLLEKGKATAVKLSNRVSMEGVISVFVNKERGVILEVNSETDFVSRGETFRDLVRDISTKTVSSGTALKNHAEKIGEVSTEDIGREQITVDNESVTVQEALVRTISKLRENLIMRRAAGIQATNQNTIIAGYAHDPNGTKQFGRLGSLVSVEYENNNIDLAELKAFADQIAVHIVGVGAQFVSIQDVPESMIEECKKNKKHPFALYDEVVLLEQKFISGEEGESVKEAVERISKKLGSKISIKSFVRYAVGEGMEKKEENYAAEVMEKLNAAKK